jgi:hypothetical protein
VALVRIVFEGGAWHDRHTQVDAGAHEKNGRAERWAKNEGETHVFQKTERTKQVEVEHDTRQGKRYTTEEAVVYELVEKKPALGSTSVKRPKKQPAETAKQTKSSPAKQQPKKAKKPAAQTSLF